MKKPRDPRVEPKAGDVIAHENGVITTISTVSKNLVRWASTAPKNKKLGTFTGVTMMNTWRLDHRNNGVKVVALHGRRITDREDKILNRRKK